MKLMLSAKSLCPLIFLIASSAASAAEVDIALASGFALFQDVQVPVNEAVQGSQPVRADGSDPGIENSTHAGFPVIFMLGYRLRPSELLGFDSGLEFVHAAGATGPKETLDASYGRMEASAGPTLNFGADRSVGVAAGYRRSSFMNVSTGHAVDTVIIRPQAKFRLFDRLSADAYYATGINANVKYLEDGTFKGRDLPGSSGSLNGFGLGFRYALASDSLVTMGYEREDTRLTIRDIYAYRKLGLVIENPRGPLSRDYALSTQIYRLGVAKTW